MNALLGMLAMALSGAVFEDEWPPAAWTQPVEPFQIVGPVYYVGSRELAAYLLVDEAGLILINVGMEQNAPLVIEAIHKLGFDPKRIRYVLITQAHADHAGGAAKIQALSGAKVMAGVADLPLLEKGGREDYVFGDALPYPAVVGPLALADGQHLICGALDLATLATPGHTPGCSSWRLTLNQGGKPIQLLFQGSISVLSDANLIQNPKYATVVADYRSTFERLAAIKPDYVLPDHVSFAAPESAGENDAPTPAWFMRPEILSQQIKRSREALAGKLTQQP